MRFDWPAKTMIALSAVSVAAYWIGHRWLWVLQVAAILVAVAFLAILFFVRKRTPKRNIVAFWLIPCTWTGLVLERVDRETWRDDVGSYRNSFCFELVRILGKSEIRSAAKPFHLTEY